MSSGKEIALEEAYKKIQGFISGKAPLDGIDELSIKSVKNKGLAFNISLKY